ncbi:unnamed protein product, partial [Mesorhabditis belari]|uniref:Trafficking protein particle complex subunit 2-like protein n=1 Tax=Mesorhabditis belari TaxID=2138241 RepID=A0AAF3F627_9BILA
MINPGNGALCISIVGKENARLWSGLSDDASRVVCEVELFAHVSLDIVDERATKATENYLGQVYSDHLYKCFAYVSSTGVKFVLVTDSKSQGLRDSEMRAIFKKLHHAYCNAISNPFYVVGQPIKSKHLTEAAKQIFAQ